VAWGSDAAATQLSSITTEQFFDQLPTLNPRETAHVQVSVDFPGSPTDHAVVAVYTTLDDSSEVWDLIPMMEFLLENATDPNRISFLATRRRCIRPENPRRTATFPPSPSILPTVFQLRP
jgi:hypothetical protein